MEAAGSRKGGAKDRVLATQHLPWEADSMNSPALVARQSAILSFENLSLKSRRADNFRSNGLQAEISPVRFASLITPSGPTTSRPNSVAFFLPFRASARITSARVSSARAITADSPGPEFVLEAQNHPGIGWIAYGKAGYLARVDAVSCQFFRHGRGNEKLAIEHAKQVRVADPGEVKDWGRIGNYYQRVAKRLRVFRSCSSSSTS